MPFLWVAPLALYLLSFILCFDHPRWYVRSVWAMLALTLILTVSGVDFMLGRLGQSHNFVVDLFLCFAALLAICMVCHGELVLLKPEPRRLTEFYLFVAAGGALGGVLVSIVAPLIFRSFFEWQLGLFLAYFVAAAALMRPETLGAAIPARAMAGVSAVIGLVCLLSWQLDLRCPVDRVRNFYGVVSVWEYRRDEPEEHNFQLVHGNIAHGEQFVAAAKRRRPTMYYGESSGVGSAIRCLQKQRPAMRVGVVGLGVGTLAAYAREGDEYEFYEINPEVPRLAKKYFTYLADCRGKCDIVLGDARLSLERPSSRKFDLLALDAFSGDSIPTHLSDARGVGGLSAAAGVWRVDRRARDEHVFQSGAGGAGGGRGRQARRRAGLRRRKRQRLEQPQRLDARGAGGRIVDGPSLAAPAAPPRRPSRPTVDRSVQQFVRDPGVGVNEGD